MLTKVNTLNFNKTISQLMKEKSSLIVIHLNISFAAIQQNLSWPKQEGIHRLILSGEMNRIILTLRHLSALSQWFCSCQGFIRDESVRMFHTWTKISCLLFCVVSYGDTDLPTMSLLMIQQCVSLPVSLVHLAGQHQVKGTHLWIQHLQWIVGIVKTDIESELDSRKMLFPHQFGCYL